MEADRIALRPLLTALAGVLALEAASYLAARESRVPALLLVGATRLIQTAWVLFAARREASGWPAIGLARKDIVPGLRQGVVWSACFATAAGLGWLVLAAAGIDPLVMVRMPMPRSAGLLSAYFLVGGVIGPVTEELVFRGLIYRYLRRWGMPAALIVSTVLFALPHFRPGGMAPVNQVVGGLVFGLAYEKSGRLPAPMAIHILGNLAIFTLAAWAGR